MHFDRGAALYALSRFEEAGQEFLRATRGPGPGAEGGGVSQPGQRAVQAGETQGRRRGLQARAGAASRRQGRQVEPGDRPRKQKKEEEKKKQDDKDKNKDDKKDDKDKDKDKQDDKDKRQERQEGQGQGQEGPARQAGQERPEGQGQAGEAAAARESGTESARAHPGDAEEPRGEPEGIWRRSGPACARYAAGRRRGTGDAGVGEKASRVAGAGDGRGARVDRGAGRGGRLVVQRVDRSGRGRARSAVPLPRDATTSDGQPDGFKPPDFSGCAWSAARSRRPGSTCRSGGGGTRSRTA